MIAIQLFWVRWAKGKRSFGFGFSIDSLKTKDHSPIEWYFCVEKAVGITSKNKHLIKYPNLRLAIRLVPYSTEIAVSELKGFFSDMLDPHQSSKNLFLIP